LHSDDDGGAASLGAKIMEPISIEAWLDTFSPPYTGKVRERTARKIQAAVNRKLSGKKCENCGNEMWAAMSGILGWDGCYPCMAGESDSSNDYEIDEVCWS
jgi:hypothetical protein